MTAHTSLPATYPDVGTARLPAVYEAAAKAIAECERIDECKGWADKAAALASYARQAKDDSLRVMAVRIQARAMRRAGELLKQIPSGQGASNQHCELHAGTVTRHQAATDAGLSARQKVTALRVASVPEEPFEGQVESADPPTVTRLAAQGTVSRNSPAAESPWVAIEGSDIRSACETLKAFARFCSRCEASGIGRSVNESEAVALRQLIATADQWLDRLAASLCAEG